MFNCWIDRRVVKKIPMAGKLSCFESYGASSRSLSVNYLIGLLNRIPDGKNRMVNVSSQP